MKNSNIEIIHEGELLLLPRIILTWRIGTMDAERNAALCDHIKALMLAGGWKQEALAKELGISQPNLSRMLSGQRPIGPVMLRKFADAFGYTTYQLMGLRERQNLPDREYLSMKEHFQRLGVPRHAAFAAAGYFEASPNRMCIGPIISVTRLCGSQGLAPEQLFIDVVSGSPVIPEHVQQRLPYVKVEGKDGDKATLVGWHQDSLDHDSGNFRLRVALSKYSMKQAMRDCAPQLIDDLIHHRVHVMGRMDAVSGARPLPCHLHCDAIVLTGDGHVVLAQRDKVDIDRDQWAASAGEGINWDLNSNSMQPLETVWRMLEEELGLHRHWYEEECRWSAKITFLELGFQLDSYIYILFSLVELPQLSIAQALERTEHRTDKEPKAFASMYFSVENCVTAVVEGVVDGKELNYASRFALMLAAIKIFGEAFDKELARRSPIAD